MTNFRALLVGAPADGHPGPMSDAGEQQRQRGPLARAGWTVLGVLAVAIGSLGIVVPGLPTTPLFIVAAACFSRSSPRLERWVLELPSIGPMVRDYREGLGMPRRAKVTALLTMAVFLSLSVVLFLDGWLVRGIVLGAGAVGAWVILFRVPTRERVLEERARTSPAD